MIQQGAVKLNNEKVSDTKTTVQKGSSNLIQVGKKKVAKIFIL
jgi:tyrosyl-tRNA synthetase